MQTACVDDQCMAASIAPSPLGSNAFVPISPDHRDIRLVSCHTRVNKAFCLVLLAGAVFMMVLSGCTPGDADDALRYDTNSDLGRQVRIQQSLEQFELVELTPQDAIHVNFEQFVSSLAPFVEYAARSSTNSLDAEFPTSFAAWESANQELLAELEQWMHANVMLGGAGPNGYLTELMHTLIFPPADFEVALNAKYGPDWPKERFDSVFESEYFNLATLWQAVNLDQQPSWLILE